MPNVPSQGGLFNWELSPISICPGLDIDGLYRVSGNLATIQKLRYKVEHGMVTHSDSGGQWGITPLEGQRDRAVAGEGTAGDPHPSLGLWTQLRCCPTPRRAAGPG